MIRLFEETMASKKRWMGWRRDWKLQDTRKTERRRESRNAGFPSGVIVRPRPGCVSDSYPAPRYKAHRRAAETWPRQRKDASRGAFAIACAR